MATLTSVQAAADYPVTSPRAGVVCPSLGTLSITANPTAADQWRMCRLPGGALTLPGWLFVADLDTGTETLDIDVGIFGATVSDPDFFGNFGVITGDAVPGYIPGVGTLLPLVPWTNATNMSGAFATMTESVVVTVTVNTAAATFSAGNISVYLPYTGVVTNTNL